MNRIERWEQNCSVLRDTKFRAKYAIEDDIIGEGSFGTVITAKCKKTQEKRAVKAIRKIDKVSMLSIELELLANLGGYFNIVKFYDFFHVLGSVAIVMEHFPHCSVSELIMTSRLDPSFALLYFRNLLTAVSYLHQNRYVHRDIKLSNFLYSPQLRSFRLVDFGLATIDRSDIEMSRETNRQILEKFVECEKCKKSDYVCLFCKSKPNRDTYHVVGTPGLRAPEILLGMGVCSPPLDIFSSGLCLLSLISLKHPFLMPNTETENILNLACLLGTRTIENLAADDGVILAIDERRKPVDFCKLMLCLRFGFDVVCQCKDWVGVTGCKNCQSISYNNPQGVCFCRPSFECNKFSTSTIPSDLISLYVDLLYNALEPDRFKRYTADRLLGVIDFYDSRENYRPTPFTNQMED